MTTPHTITIHTDRGPLTLPQGSHLADAVEALLQHTSQAAVATAVATAVNGQFVARHLRATHPLHDGDTVLCFSPITGG
mgnify:CR=1 FL=1